MTDARIKPKARAEDTIRDVLRNLAQSLVAHLDAMGAEPDADAVHDLRVLLRRTRTLLTHSKGVLPEPARSDARAVLRDLAAATGPARDLQVLLDGWELHASAVGEATPEGLALVHRELTRRRDEATDSALAQLEELSAGLWLRGWVAWLEDPATTSGGKGPRTGAVVTDQVKRARRKVVRHGRSLDASSPDEDLHRLRKDVKALRYLLEAYAGLFPPGEVRSAARRLRSLQDDLGAHQDAATQRLLFTFLASDLAVAAADPGAVRAAELLRDDAGRRLDAHRSATLQSFAAYDTPANKRRLKGLLTG